MTRAMNSLRTTRLQTRLFGWAHNISYYSWLQEAIGRGWLFVSAPMAKHLPLKPGVDGQSLARQQVQRRKEFQHRQAAARVARLMDHLNIGARMDDDDMEPEQIEITYVAASGEPAQQQPASVVAHVAQLTQEVM